jgi:hypothetical protein
MVDVSNKQNSTVIKVTGSNGNTNITASSDTAQYWSKQSRLSAENSKESAQESKHYAELANSYIEGFEGVVTNNTNNIIATSNDYINQINNTANEANATINTNKTNAINEINTTKNSAVSSVNTTKTSAITEINNTKTTAVNAVNTSKNQALDAIEQESSSIVNFKEEVQAELDEKVDIDDMVAFEMKEVPCITETYINGTSGYNLYANGYCEQWGKASIATNSSGQITFLKAFKDTNFNLSCAPSTDSKMTSTAVYVAYTGISTTGVTFYVTANMGTGSSTICWRACGYIA